MFIRPYFELDEVYAEVDLVDDESIWDAYDYAELQPGTLSYKESLEPEALLDRVDRNSIYWNWKSKNWDIEDEFDMEFQWYMRLVKELFSD